MLIVIKRADGGVSMFPRNGKTDDEVAAYIKKISPNLPADYVSHHEIDAVPAEAVGERTFRNALISNGKAVIPDMAKAREIWKGRMRNARAPKMAALDVEMTRAFADPKQQAAIDAKRQQLRDVTGDPAIEQAQTLDDLKKVWPQTLT